MWFQEITVGEFRDVVKNIGKRRLSELNYFVVTMRVINLFNSRV